MVSLGACVEAPSPPALYPGAQQMKQDCQGGQPAACFALAYVARQNPAAVDFHVEPPALVAQGKRLVCAEPAAQPAASRPRAPSAAPTDQDVSAGAKADEEARLREAHLAWAAKPTAPLSEALNLRVLVKSFGVDPDHYGKVAIPFLLLDSFDRTDWQTMAISLGMPDSVEYQRFLNRLQGDLVLAMSRYSDWVAKEGLADAKKDEMVQQVEQLQRWTRALRRQVDHIAESRRSPSR